ncbi:hypothetical protein V0R50_11015, partial [Pseudomonas sp. 148P]|nr:hypothetical protein [Pseudomonas sp. 148P]
MKKTSVAIWVLIACLFLGGFLLIWQDNDLVRIRSEDARWMATAALLGCGFVLLFLQWMGVLGSRRLGAVDFIAPLRKKHPEPAYRPDKLAAGTLVHHLRGLYGPLWRRKTRLLLVAGEPEQIEAIAPGLSEQRWLVGERTVLLWAGSLRKDPDPADL